MFEYASRIKTPWLIYRHFTTCAGILQRTHSTFLPCWCMPSGSTSKSGPFPPLASVPIWSHIGRNLYIGWWAGFKDWHLWATSCHHHSINMSLRTVSATRHFTTCAGILQRTHSTFLPCWCMPSGSTSKSGPFPPHWPLFTNLAVRPEESARGHRVRLDGHIAHQWPHAPGFSKTDVVIVWLPLLQCASCHWGHGVIRRLQCCILTSPTQSWRAIENGWWGATPW